MATELATLGGGCFWCLEPLFTSLRGVERSVSGYAGGHVTNPSYDSVSGGQTGHAEVVQLTFDPDQISFADLLRVFFTTHDPTTGDRQGNDSGPQYRSIILTSSPAQETTAREIVAEFATTGVFASRITTEIKPLDTFYPAEPEHQDYYGRNPGSAYCKAVIPPKIAKFRQLHADRVRTESAP